MNLWFLSLSLVSHFARKGSTKTETGARAVGFSRILTQQSRAFISITFRIRRLNLKCGFQQDYVARKWTKMSDIDGNSLREFLYQGALRQNQIQFITIKYIKVFVNIGIRQWKTNSTFFDQIMQVLYLKFLCSALLYKGRKTKNRSIPADTSTPSPISQIQFQSTRLNSKTAFPVELENPILTCRF